MKVVNKLLVCIALMMAFVACNSNTDKTVTIKGKVVNTDQDAIVLENYSLKSSFLMEEKQEIALNENKEFEYTFSISKPAYYKIGRNYLYLSPGDNVEMVLDATYRDKAEFKGVGAEANQYLAALPYPKAGSFFMNLPNRGAGLTYKDLPAKFDSICNAMKDKLHALNKLSEEFVKQEEVRLDFEYANSLKSVSYLYFKFMKDRETFNAKIGEAMTFYIPFLSKALANYNNNAYCDFEAFHALLGDLSDKAFTDKHSLPEMNAELKEYMLAENLINGFKYNGYSKEYEAKFSKGAKNIKNKEYLKALDIVKEKISTIRPGAMASDLTFSNVEGKDVKLSDFKGKVIVVDIWATWCGPCMHEKPFFAKLSEKYVGKDVEFLTVSVDTKRVWNKYMKKHPAKGNQLRIDRKDLDIYQVAGIPRFFVIDRDFKIVDVFAPRPSSGDLEKLINTVL